MPHTRILYKIGRRKQKHQGNSSLICACPVIQLLMVLPTAGVYPPKLKPAVCTSNVCYQDSFFTTLRIASRGLSRILSPLKYSKTMYTNSKAQEVSLYTRQHVRA